MIRNSGVVKQEGSATPSGKGMAYATSARLFSTEATFAVIRDELAAWKWALPDRMPELSAP
jgi:hypothetical protein